MGAVEAIERACVLCAHCIQNDWASTAMNLHQICVKLHHSSAETIWMIEKAAGMGNWWLVASSRQWACSCITSGADIFGKTSNHPGYSAPLWTRFDALWLLAFPQTKITFEREEISDHWCHLGKHNGAADGNWENCVESQGAYLEGNWGFLSCVECFFYPVSSLTNVSIFHITWMDTF